MVNISSLGQNNVPANLRKNDIQNSSSFAANLLNGTSKQDNIHLSFKQETEELTITNQESRQETKASNIDLKTRLNAIKTDDWRELNKGVVSLVLDADALTEAQKKEAASFIEKELSRLSRKNYAFNKGDEHRKDSHYFDSLIRAAFDLRNPDFIAKLCLSHNELVRKKVYDSLEFNYITPSLSRFLYYRDSVGLGEKKANSLQEEDREFGKEVAKSINKIDPNAYILIPNL